MRPLAKLVKHILKGDYMDISELLNDNMEADRRRALLEGEGAGSSFSNNPLRREVLSRCRLGWHQQLATEDRACIVILRHSPQFKPQ